MADAFRYLDFRQKDAAGRKGVTTVARGDHSRQMLDEHKADLRPSFRVLARALTYIESSYDLAGIRATVFARLSRKAIREAVRRIPVGMIPTVGYFASTEAAPRGGPVILVSLHFLGTIAAVTEWCSAASPYWGAAEITPARAAAAITTRLDWKRVDQFEEPRIRSFVKDVSLGKLPDAAVYFGIAHELAHAFGDLHGSTTHEIEYAADALGFDLAVDVAGHPFNFGSSCRRGAAAAEIVLQSISLSERLGLVRAQASHPSGKLRLERLHQHIGEFYGKRFLDYLRPFQACFEEAHAAAG